MLAWCVIHGGILCIERALRRRGLTARAGGDWRVQGTSDTAGGLVRVFGGARVSRVAAGVLHGYVVRVTGRQAAVSGL